MERPAPVGGLNPGCRSSGPRLPGANRGVNLETDLVDDEGDGAERSRQADARGQGQIGGAIGRHEETQREVVDGKRSNSQVGMERHLERVGAAEMDAIAPRPLDAERNLDAAVTLADKRLEERIAFAARQDQRQPFELRAQHDIQRAVAGLRREVDGGALELQPRRTRRAEQQRRRLRREIEADTDAGGRRRRAGLERIPDRGISRTQQDAELRRRVGAGQQPEIDGRCNVELERELLGNLRLDDHARQLAVLALQLHQRERGFQVLVGDRDVVERNLQEPGGVVQALGFVVIRVRQQIVGGPGRDRKAKREQQLADMLGQQVEVAGPACPSRRPPQAATPGR